MRSGRPTSAGFKRSRVRSSRGSTWYFAASLREEVLQLLQLLRVLRGEIVGQAEVRPGVVQLPGVLLERRPWLELPRRAVDGAGEPAVVVDRPIAEDLEVLGGVPARRLGVREGVGQAHAFDGGLDRSV